MSQADQTAPSESSQRRQRPGDSRPGAIPVPTPPISGKRDGIALCMSGGGFRASLFHLGSLRRLHEVGVLHKVKTISSVSGGSILAGYLAGLIIRRKKLTNVMHFDNWETEVAAGFRAVAGRDLRTLPVLLHLLWNWAFPGPRVRQVVGRDRERLTSKMLNELPQKPEFVFCATDMVFGVNWEFRRDEAGELSGAGIDPERPWSG